MSRELEVMPQDKNRDREPVQDKYKVPADFILDDSKPEEERRREMLREFGRRGGKATAKKLGKYRPRFAEMAKKLAALGLPQADMAALFGVHERTFKAWIRKNKALATALKEGESVKKTGLLKSMMQSVKNGSFAVQIFLAKNWLGMTDRVDTKHSGEIEITYKSHIPKEKGRPDIDKDSIKKTPGKRK